MTLPLANAQRPFDESIEEAAAGDIIDTTNSRYACGDWSSNAVCRDFDPNQGWRVCVTKNTEAVCLAWLRNSNTARASTQFAAVRALTSRPGQLASARNRT